MSESIIRTESKMKIFKATFIPNQSNLVEDHSDLLNSNGAFLGGAL